MLRAGSPGLLSTLLLIAAASASPSRIVAIGDGLVGVPSAAPAESSDGDASEGQAPAADRAGGEAQAAGHTPSPGGWTTVLADCLEEGAPAQWAVTDQTQTAETAQTALERVEDVAELRPDVVLVSVGAQELAVHEPAVIERDAGALVGALNKGKSPPVVLLVGVVSPSLTQVPGERSQQELDERTDAVNGVLARLAQTADTVHHVDLWDGWPRDDAGRAQLTAGGWNLSAQGHARVAAIVCDKVLSWAKAQK